MWYLRSTKVSHKANIYFLFYVLKPFHVFIFLFVCIHPIEISSSTGTRFLFDLSVVYSCDFTPQLGLAFIFPQVYLWSLPVVSTESLVIKTENQNLYSRWNFSNSGFTNF
ncbi:unnamed protein product [Orchesella dallaii]|uniref:Uncharacterized protein n=1 Tax=Orchesella dallaii TaxID=48710 RepID=A0ABP1RFD6_9HEXA